MKHFAVATASLILLAVSAPAFAAGATVKVINVSDYAIHHMFVSSVDTEKWGPDQLGEHVVNKGETFTLNNVPCDSYDIKVVDEDGDECVIPDADLCADNSYWKITNEELLGCEGYGDDE